MEKFILKIAEEGKEEIIGQFDTFEDLKMFLVQNTKKYFAWINDNVDPAYVRTLPDFAECENANDVKAVLDDYDYDWWSMVVER